MFPHERSLVKRLEGKPFVLIGVNADDDKKAEEIKKLNEENKITWRSFRNKRGDKQPEVATEWNLAGYPTLYLIDHKGIIRKKWVGGPEEKALDTAIEGLVKVAAGEVKQ